MVLNNFFLLLIISSFLNFYFVNGITINFIPVTGEWSDDNNWNIGFVPTTSDIALISKSDQTCISSINKIVTGQIIVGSLVTTNSKLVLNGLGVDADQLHVFPNSIAIFNIIKDPIELNNHDYYVNIPSITTYGYLQINGIFNSNSTFKNTSIASFGTAGKISISNTKFNGNILYVSDNSTISISDSTEIIIGSMFGENSQINMINTDLILALETTKFNSTSVYLSNSTFRSHNSIQLVQSSKLQINGGRFQLYDKTNEQTIGFYIKDSLIYAEYSSFLFERIIGIYSSPVTFIKSVAVMYNDFYLLQDSTMILDGSSVVKLDSLVQVKDNSKIIIINKSELQISGSVYLDTNGIIGGYSSTIHIQSKQSNETSFPIIDNGSLFFSESVVILEAYLKCFDDSTVTFDKSNVYFNSYAHFLNNSKLNIINSTSMVLGDNLYMQGNSNMYIKDSQLTVNGSIALNENSFLSILHSFINIDGFLSDYTNKSKSHFLSIFDSTVKVNGYFNTFGYVNLLNSTVECSKSFIIGGGLIARNNTNIIVKDGNFTIGGTIEMVDSTIEMRNGMILFYEYSYTKFENSIIKLENGAFLIEKGSTISLLNTTILNSNTATMDIKCDIVVQSNSSISNSGAHFILSSNILPGDDKTGNEYFNNVEGGIFEIGEDSTTTTTNIMIPFINNQATINIGRETTLLSFSSVNGGTIILSNPNAIIHSNNSLIISNSSLQGTGLINSSVILSNGSKVGNEQITNLTINGNLDSNQDQFTFTIGGDESTFINVGNATINNSTLIIRISALILESKQNTTLLNSTMISGNGFTKVIFKSYDPSTGVEQQLEACKHKIELERGTLGLLLNGGDTKTCMVEDLTVVETTNDTKKLSNGAIAGIVVGIVGGAVVVAALIYFRNRIPLTQRLSYRLKNISQT